MWHEMQNLTVPGQEHWSSLHSYLLLTVRNVADAAPGEGFVRVELAVGAVDVKTLSIHSKQQICVPLVLL